MRLNHPSLHRQALSSFLAVFITLAIFLATPVYAAAPQASDLPTVLQRQVFYDNLRVRGGQTVEGDVVVYQGNVTVEKEGAIRGDLVVYSGNVQVERGGVVNGNITALSGNVTIDGTVNGSVTAWSGNVRLGGDAVVDGDISVVSGEISQTRGSVVRGNVLRGPSVNMDLLPLSGLSALANMRLAPRPQPPSAMEIFLGLVARTLRALLLLGVAVGVGALLMVLRPAWVEQTRATLVARTPLSFAVGLIFNLFGLAFIGILWITVCFRPPAALLGLVLTAVNLAGLTALGEELGRRVEKALNLEWGVPARTAVGVLIPGALVAFFWIIGGCLNFFAYLIAIIVGSLGVGAILVNVLKLGEQAAAPSPAFPSSPTSPTAGGETPGTGQPAEASIVEAPMGQPAAAEPVESVTPGEAAEEHAPEPITQTGDFPDFPHGTGIDDFTQINGIGPVFDRRLKEAGIFTFEALAQRSAEEIAKIIQWPVARVVRTQIIEQARELAQRKGR
ncbi:MULTISPECIES: polymer-forming cytoskeletal protein [Caldilinea]|jgi:predicted flap endonuclease-1-like 5' DNA nuclease/cytoskeletal protein CcmA (bactofilin family)|uniref:Polymer-forming cytoskeletal protein n=1 Tax=Caldilinea aerophila (strain DSM 14535 / JCM 11387 / NBRC 104270 / STL-6-O1) TaxID=926550 RepID=I0I563_CALAS|nr:MULTISPECIES: polymer-forming cytoskeletal protein [Caldilinea]MBO9391951.1 polymer-forming cytoskeletal protein [Caldilinea sp.]BAM00401.1 hypothetical protein CLDAP_23610 [Caldilinea aerophila DSM 14535 = NBRC 104270]GIV71755.1 MAG: hypothetical protein KatS3mg049_0311 [Caldilinea sp.]